MANNPYKPNRLPQNRVRPGVPYDPRIQPDVEQFEQFRRQFRPYSPLSDNFVLTTYDALPPRANAYYQEFYQQSATQDEDNDVPVTATAVFAPVPKGRTLIVRAVSIFIAIETDETAAGIAYQQAALINLNGAPEGGQTGRGSNNQFPRLTFFNNDVPDPLYNNLFINDALIDSHHLPFYGIFSEDEVFSLAVTWEPLTVTGAGDAKFWIMGAVYGDLLYSKGTDPILEPVNTRSVPVETSTPEIVDERRK